jgi:hypothetical protein
MVSDAAEKGLVAPVLSLQEESPGPPVPSVQLKVVVTDWPT